MSIENSSASEFDEQMIQRAAEYFDARDTETVFGESINSRHGVIRYCFKHLQGHARALNDILDPEYTYVIRDTVISYVPQEVSDIFSTENESRTAGVEENVALWPLELVDEEKIQYTHMFLDTKGRLFGLGARRSADTMRDFGPHIPVEILMNSVEPFDALAAEQAGYELTETLRIIKNLPKN